MIKELALAFSSTSTLTRYTRINKTGLVHRFVVTVAVTHRAHSGFIKDYKSNYGPSAI